MNSHIDLRFPANNLVATIRVVGLRTALFRLKVMQLLIAFAAIVGGVRHIDVDVSYRD